MEHKLIVRCLCAGFFGFALGLLVLNIGSNPVAQEPTATMDLEGTTLGIQVPSTVSIAHNKLMAHGINPGPLGMIALTAIDANNRGIGMRNVAAMAAKLPSETKAALSNLGKEVVVRSDVKMGVPGKLAGVTPPFGFFDPAGFTSQIDTASIAFYREAELKHGRVGMIATLGIIVDEKFTSLLGADSVPAVLRFGKATPAGPAQFWGAAIVAVAFLELIWLNTQQWGDKDYKDPLQAGDFGWDPLGMKPKKADELMTLQNKELNNGRLAMIAAAGIIAQELVTGKKVF